MKKVLLTESEYRKVCEILGENIDDVIAMNAERKGSYEKISNRYKNDLEYRNGQDDFENAVYKYVKDNYEVYLKDNSNKWDTIQLMYDNKSKAKEFVDDLRYMLKNSKDDKYLSNFTSKIGNKYITIEGMRIWTITKAFKEFHKLDIVRNKEIDDLEYADKNSGRSEFINTRKKVLNTKVKSNFRELTTKYQEAFDEKLNEKFLKRFGAFSIVKLDFDVCDENGGFISRKDFKEGNKVIIEFESYDLTVRERSKSTRMYQSNLEKNAGKIIKSVINGKAIGEVVDGENFIVELDFDTIDDFVEKIMSKFSG